jgi:hypothetical protein
MTKTHEGAAFIKSSYSQSDCVAVARAASVAVADTKSYGDHGPGPSIVVSRGAWTALLSILR